eukprot:6463788-Amphidinium_carterae.1
MSKKGNTAFENEREFLEYHNTLQKQFEQAVPPVLESNIVPQPQVMSSQTKADENSIHQSGSLELVVMSRYR